MKRLQRQFAQSPCNKRVKLIHLIDHEAPTAAIDRVAQARALSTEFGQLAEKRDSD